ncbi:MAG: hypothetical protein IJX55_03320 [Clostridia bacterium]|nr:hypothetical protein [Clostridia bacterium]
MKNIKKFIVLMLVFAVCTVMFASCGNKKDEAVASFGGDSYIYADDKDFSDFYNLFTYYYKIESVEEEMSTLEYNIILRNSVQATVEMRLLEDESARRGYFIDMEEVEAEAYEDQKVFENAYPGGFATFCEHWGLSEDVFLTVNKYEALQELAKENFFTTQTVKEEEALAYYEKNKDDFIKKPHYEIKELFLQVTKDTNKEAVYNDAKVYIGMLNSGRSWESVLNTAKIKYNLENGMIFSHYLTGSEIIEKNNLETIGSTNNLMNEVFKNFEEKYGITYSEMFPDGFDAYIEKNEIEEGSFTYKKVLEAHMTYCSEVYNVEMNYAVTEKWETGKCYSFPIYHGGFESYVVLYFSSVEDEEGEVSFEQAKEDIIELILEERREKAFEDFISRRMDEANLQIKYEN